MYIGTLVAQEAQLGSEVFLDTEPGRGPFGPDACLRVAAERIVTLVPIAGCQRKVMNVEACTAGQSPPRPTLHPINGPHPVPVVVPTA